MNWKRSNVNEPSDANLTLAEKVVELLQANLQAKGRVEESPVIYEEHDRVEAACYIEDRVVFIQISRRR